KPNDVNKNNTITFYRYFTEDNDGLWRIRLYAPNYIYNINSQIESGGSWLDSTKFYPNNNSRTQIFINTTHPWTQGMASRTIAQIENVNQTQVNLEVQTDSYSSITSSIYNITWSVSANAIGTYRSIVRWNDSISGGPVSKVGFNYINFEVWRKTNVNIYIDKSYEYGNSFLQPGFLPFKATWTDQLSNPISNGYFYIEYNSTSYTIINYTSFTEGRGVNKGNYSINLPTSALKPGSQNVTCYLFKKYFDSKIVNYFINQTVDISVNVITPEQKWNLTTYYAETLEINNYNITVQFFDEFEQKYIQNGSAPWMNVQVKIDFLNGSYLL
ncbi:MAG: hypothetical protein ACTSRP_19085, partial [Candidatus Helarchaeota archaeon]